MGAMYVFIRWQKTFETGHALIDTQHRLLVFLFKRLDAAIKTGQPPARLYRIVLETRKFVEFHFVSEENLMEETGYPDLAYHRKVHTDLLLELNLLIGKVSSRREFPDDLLYFMNKWLIEHIGGHDQRVALHARDGVERPVAELFYMEYFPALPSRE
jgi:hemerythrin